MPFGIPGSYSKKGGGLASLLAPLFHMRKQQEEEEEQQPSMLSSLIGDYQQNEDEMQTPVFDQYLETLQNAPRREDFQPSTGRKILAGLAGAATGFTSGAAAGSKAVQDITEAPFRNARRDFENELEPLEKGVGFEKAFGETLRKRTADRQGFGAKLARIESDYTKAKGQLEVAKQRAATAQDLARIKEAENNLDAEYQRQKIEIDRMNAGSNRMRAGAAQTSANARARNADIYAKQGGARPRHVSVTEQLTAEAAGGKEALDEILEQMPDLASTGVIKLSEDGKLVFPKDMSEATKSQLTKIWKDKKAEKAKGRLGVTR